MRKDNFGINDFVHVYNRGNRKQAIVKDDHDRIRFLRLLYYFNTKITPSNPMQSILKSNFNNWEWPEKWQPRAPIVKILSFILLDNHFHLLLKEIVEGGTTLFMRRLGTGMTNYSNIKYQESGKLFQGSYKAKRVGKDSYLKYLCIYIQVKNLLELYPRGASQAIKSFDKFYKWATDYKFSSLVSYSKGDSLPIIDKDIFLEIFPNPKSFDLFAKDCILSMNLEEELGDMAIDY